MSTAALPLPTDISPGNFASKRKRSRSRSPSRDAAPQPPANRRRSLSPSRRGATSEIPRVEDVDPVRRKERERQLAMQLAEKELNGKEEKEKPAYDAAAEFAKLVSSRSGGVYMPPSRLRALQAEAAKDKASPEYQRLSWDALRKSITGIVNRVNVTNIKDIVPELFSENLIRGRGLFCRSIMKAQGASLPFTPVFAALVAIINTKLPQVGELLVTRLISQFRRSFKRNDKTVCHATTTFIAHLVNQSVADEIIALQILILLMERPTDDSVEIAVGFMREVGAYLSENSAKANASIYERFRAVLNEGSISQRVQYMIEVLMQVRKDKYKDNPIIPEGLDLVVEDEQITHQIALDEDLQVQEGLNIFKFDPNYMENEEKYKEIKAEILGEGSSDEESEEDSEEEDEEEEAVADKEGIEDQTSTNLVNLRRTIYLSIMNALNYEEAVHKLLKVQIKEGEEIELMKMVIECCSQERSYSKFYGLIGERFSKLNRVWTDALEDCFREYYDTIHRYETNRLRNISRFFGHMLASDAISWAVLQVVKMNEDDTTSASRIFVKIMFGEVLEEMGMATIVERFKDPEVKHFCSEMFPMDNPKNTRFSINYFTSIGLGAVTEEMREHLKNAPRIIMEQRRALMEEESSSDSDSDPSSDSDSDSSDSDDSDSDDSSDDSRSRGGYRRRRGPSRSPTASPRQHRRSSTPPRREVKDRGRRDDSRSPPPRRRYDSRSPTPPRDAPRKRYASRSRSPIPRRKGYDSDSRSPPPPAAARRRRYSSSRSRSPPPPPRRGGYSDARDRDQDRDRPYGRGRDYSPNGRDRDRSPPPPPSRYDRDRREGRRDSPPHASNARRGSLSPVRSRYRSPSPSRKSRRMSPDERERSRTPPRRTLRDRSVSKDRYDDHRRR